MRISLEGHSDDVVSYRVRGTDAALCVDEEMYPDMSHPYSLVLSIFDEFGNFVADVRCYYNGVWAFAMIYAHTDNDFMELTSKVRAEIEPVVAEHSYTSRMTIHMPDDFTFLVAGDDDEC